MMGAGFARPVVSIRIVIELALLLDHEAAEHVHQVAANRAADASVVDEHDVLLSILLERDELAVDVNLAKLVLDDHDALSVVTRENAVQERRLAGSADGSKRHEVRCGTKKT